MSLSCPPSSAAKRCASLVLRVVVFVATAVLALAGAGCGVSSNYMAVLETPAPIAVDASQATVVFIRPSNYAGHMKTVILDQHGRFLGESWGKTYFSVKMPPGQYQFISWGEGTPVLSAQIEPGKVYYVEIGTVIGAWTARARLFGIGPQRPSGAELPGWLGKCEMLIPDEGAGAAYLQSRGDDVQSVLRKAQDSWNGYDAESRMQRSIGPGDGFPAPVAARID